MDVLTSVVMVVGLFAVFPILVGLNRLYKTQRAEPTSQATVKPQAPTQKTGNVSSVIHNPSHVKPSALRWLPSAFYVIACLGFVAFLILAVQAGSGYLFGYGIGTTIACLGGGRVIELLQNIDDKLEQKRTSK